MLMEPLQKGSILGGRHVVRELLHRSSCGDWYDTAPISSVRSRHLPTEFTYTSAASTRRVRVVVRKPASDEELNLDVAGLPHRFLTEVSQAERMTDDIYQGLLVQTTAYEPRGTIAELLPGQLVAHWRDIVAAVASAVAHLHALGLSHGAVSYDNIFQCDSMWHLGPTRCSGRADRVADLRALAGLIGIDLRREVKDPSQNPLIDQLVEICLAERGGAACVAVCAWRGYGAFVPDLLVDGSLETPEVALISGRLRVSLVPHGRAVLVDCLPHRLPQPGALVPESQLDQLGTLLPMDALNEAEVKTPQRTTAVFCAVLADGLARIGSHVLVEPLREWGTLHAMIRRDGVALQWFWPRDVTCRRMVVQLRPDRYPKGETDSCELKVVCDRPVYEAAGQCLVAIPQHWNRVFVRLARTDQDGVDDGYAVYATAERPTARPSAGASWSVRKAFSRA